MEGIAADEADGTIICCPPYAPGIITNVGWSSCALNGYIATAPPACTGTATGAPPGGWGMMYPVELETFTTCCAWFCKMKNKSDAT